MREEIGRLIREAIEELQEKGDFSGFEIPEISVEAQKEGKYGDYSSNVAFQLAKIMKKSPEEITKLLISNFKMRISSPSSILPLKEGEEGWGRGNFTKMTKIPFKREASPIDVPSPIEVPYRMAKFLNNFQLFNCF